MSSLREMRLRIRSVRNIAQVTRALQTVSASKARRAQAALTASRPYAEKALDVLRHLAGRRNAVVHPMLQPRNAVEHTLVVLVSGDRGLAGAYNANVVRAALQKFDDSPSPVHYVVIGRKGREMLLRMGKRLTADFSNLPTTPAYADVSSIGRLAIEEFLEGKADEVYVVYTDFITLIHQRTVVRQLLPVPAAEEEEITAAKADLASSGSPPPAYIFEPGQADLLDQIIPRLVAIQIFEAILESLASEHAARMVTMRNATENAQELIGGLRLHYNKARQQAITSDLLDIAAGTEALAAQTEHRIGV